METPEIKVISTQEFITDALQKYTVTDEYIAKIKAELVSFVITDTKDKEGYKRVSAAITKLTGLRSTVEKTRKELKEVALVYGRAVDGEAKRITAALEELENPLRKQKEYIDQCIEDEKQAEAKRLAEQFNARTIALFSLGFNYNGTRYVLGDMFIETDDIQAADAEEWTKIIGFATENAERFKAAQAKAEEERKRLEVARKQLEEETAKVAKLRAELEAREEALKPKATPKVASSYTGSGHLGSTPTAAPPPWGKPATEPSPMTADGPQEDTEDDPRDWTYIKGHNDGLRKVLNILKSPEPFTRASLRDSITKLIIA